MAKYVTRSTEYNIATVIIPNMEKMVFEEKQIVVENPANDEREYLLQIATILDVPFSSVKLKGKTETKKEYRRMDIATWLEYSEVFDPTPKNPRNK